MQDDQKIHIFIELTILYNVESRLRVEWKEEQ